MPYDATTLPAVTTPTYTEVGRVLIEARERLMLGWCQERYRKRRFILFGPVSYCAAGAILFIKNTPTDIRYGAYRAIESFTGNDKIVRWNDAPNRRQEDVLKVFDRAIATQVVV